VLVVWFTTLPRYPQLNYLNGYGAGECMDPRAGLDAVEKSNARVDQHITYLQCS